MSNVIGFPDPEAKKPHWSGSAQCRRSPEHSWVAVVPRSANPWMLKCPRGCGMTGHLIGAQPDDPYTAKRWAEEMWNERDSVRETK